MNKLLNEGHAELIRYIRIDRHLTKHLWSTHTKQHLLGVLANEAILVSSARTLGSSAALPPGVFQRHMKDESSIFRVLTTSEHLPVVHA